MPRGSKLLVFAGVVSSIAVEQDFPVPVVAELGLNHTRVFFKVSGNWAFMGRGPETCAIIVQRPEDCAELLFSRDGSCPGARALWNASELESFLGLEVDRPPFTVGLDVASGGANHSLCLRRPREEGTSNASVEVKVAGRLSYYPLPSVHFVDRVVRVSVRTFLNPGWRQEVRVPCENCSAANRLGVRPLEPVCREAGGLAAAVHALTAKTASPLSSVRVRIGPWGGTPVTCTLVQPGSACAGYLDTAAEIASFAPGPTGATFVLESERRLSTKDRRTLFHHTSALCFYPDEGAPEGILVGHTEFAMDGPDVQAFVGFVCFFGIALPLICMVTVLLHVNKQQRCKQHVQEVRLQFQRDQLEHELSDRRSRSLEAGTSSRLQGWNG